MTVGTSTGEVFPDIMSYKLSQMQIPQTPNERVEESFGDLLQFPTQPGKDDLEAQRTWNEIGMNNYFNADHTPRVPDRMAMEDRPKIELKPRTSEGGGGIGPNPFENRPVTNPKGTQGPGMIHEEIEPKGTPLWQWQIRPKDQVDPTMSDPVIGRQGFNINTDHDVKSGAAASKNSDTVYVDPSIPSEFHPFLAVHETTEKELMAQGMKYDRAHYLATLAEKHAVESAGGDWRQYTMAVDPYVADASGKEAKNPPPDPHIDPDTAIEHHVNKAAELERYDLSVGKRYAMADEAMIRGGKVKIMNAGGGGRGQAGGSVSQMRNPANDNSRIEYDPEFKPSAKDWATARQEMLRNADAGKRSGALDSEGQIKLTPYEEAAQDQAFKRLMREAGTDTAQSRANALWNPRYNPRLQERIDENAERISSKSLLDKVKDLFKSPEAKVSKTDWDAILKENKEFMQGVREKMNTPSNITEQDLKQWYGDNPKALDQAMRDHRLGKYSKFNPHTDSWAGKTIGEIDQGYKDFPEPPK